MSASKDREKRREERIAAESKAASGDRRTRLLQLAAGGVFLAIIAVVVIIIVAGSGGSGGGGDKPTGEQRTEVDKLLGNIPQNGTVLGKASAPVTLYEYGDLQCPVCKQYSEEILPPFIE
jgi:protein-disulfide isomerase